MAQSETVPAKPRDDQSKGETRIKAPVVIDLGRRRSRLVKALRRGEPGKLMDEVIEVVAELQEKGAVGETAQPVVIVVERRRRDRASLGGFPLYLPFGR